MAMPTKTMNKMALINLWKIKKKPTIKLMAIMTGKTLFRRSRASLTVWRSTELTDAIFCWRIFQTKTSCISRKIRSPPSCVSMLISWRKTKCWRSTTPTTWTSISRVLTAMSEIDWSKTSRKQAKTISFTRTRSIICSNRVMNQIGFHWPSRMRPLAWDNNKIEVSRKPSKSHIRD